MRIYRWQFVNVRGIAVTVRRGLVGDGRTDLSLFIDCHRYQNDCISLCLSDTIGGPLSDVIVFFDIVIDSN
jgi:hypothetical protein